MCLFTCRPLSNGDLSTVTSLLLYDHRQKWIEIAWVSSSSALPSQSQRKRGNRETCTNTLVLKSSLSVSMSVEVCSSRKRGNPFAILTDCVLESKLIATYSKREAAAARKTNTCLFFSFLSFSV